MKSPDCTAATIIAIMDEHPASYSWLAKQRVFAVRRDNSQHLSIADSLMQAMVCHDTSSGDWLNCHAAEWVLNPCRMVCCLQAPNEADGSPGKLCGSVITLTKGSIHRIRQHWLAHTKRGPFAAQALRCIARLDRLLAHALPLDGERSAPLCPPPERVGDITPLLGNYPTYVPFPYALSGYGPIVTGTAHVRPVRAPGEQPAAVTTMLDIALALRTVVDADFAARVATAAGIKPWPPLPRATAPLALPDDV
jgi:hypothetical protein